MNTTFKLGAVSIPVPGLEFPVTIEGLEISVTDYNLLEGLKVLKELPSILAELKAVVEDDFVPPLMEEDCDCSIPVSNGFASFLEEALKNAPKQPKFSEFPTFKKTEAHPLEGLFGNLGKSPMDAPKTAFEHFLDKKAEEAKKDMPESLKKLLASQGIDTSKVKVIKGSLEDMIGLFDKGTNFDKKF